MAMQTGTKAGRHTKARLESAGNTHAAELLLGYYRSIDLGSVQWVLDQAAVLVCEHLHPLILDSARKLVVRRTGLRGRAALQAAEDVSCLVLSNLLTRIQPGSPLRRFDPAKRELKVFLWVLVDRAIISDICRRRLPVSFSTIQLADGQLICNRTGSPGEDSEYRDQTEEVRLAVQLLPVVTRQVMERVYLEGEGKKKVAQSMDRSPSFVTREIAKGLTLLKRTLVHLRLTGKWVQDKPKETQNSQLEA